MDLHHRDPSILFRSLPEFINKLLFVTSAFQGSPILNSEGEEKKKIVIELWEIQVFDLMGATLSVDQHNPGQPSDIHYNNANNSLSQELSKCENICKYFQALHHSLVPKMQIFWVLYKTLTTKKNGGRGS